MQLKATTTINFISQQVNFHLFHCRRIFESGASETEQVNMSMNIISFQLDIEQSPKFDSSESKKNTKKQRQAFFSMYHFITNIIRFMRFVVMLCFGFLLVFFSLSFVMMFMFFGMF